MTFGRPLGTRYLLGERLGRGAVGQVYRAQRRDDGASVAVKLLRSDWAEDDTVVARFLQEKRILTSLDHPNIVRVLDLVVDAGDVGIVMELLSGGDLRALVRLGPLPAADAVTLGGQLGAALAAAHQAGIVHGDVKPENVMLTAALPAGTAKLGDFGVARMADATATTSSGRAGTPTYMAPETVTGDPVGSEADVYSLGILLYEALTGRPPFVETSPMALWHHHTYSEPDRADGISDAWWQLLQEMLAKQPHDRPSAARVASLLRSGREEPDHTEPDPLTATGSRSAGDSLPPTVTAEGPQPDVPGATVFDQDTVLKVPQNAIAADPARPDRVGHLRPRSAIVAAGVAAAVLLGVATAWAAGVLPAKARGGPGTAVAEPGTATGTDPASEPAPGSSTTSPAPTTPTSAPASTSGSAAPAQGAPALAADGTGTAPRSFQRTPRGAKTVVVTATATRPRPSSPTAAPDTTAQCQAASNAGQLVIGPELTNAGGPNIVPPPCAAIWLRLTQVQYITYAQACLEDSSGNTTECGNWVYLLDGGRWNRLLNGVSGGDRWKLTLKAEGQGTVAFRFSG